MNEKPEHPPGPLRATARERPILFSAPMVRALLAGTKTQTRRQYKVRKHPDTSCDMTASELVREEQHVIDRTCPYGQPGNRLWVKETWAQPIGIAPGSTVYRADYPACAPAGVTDLPAADQIRWKSSLFMPRVASRILLEIVSVRLERLNQCSEADARAEGALGGHGAIPGFSCDATPLEHYRYIWESINGAGSWDANPWVWVIEFERLNK